MLKMLKKISCSELASRIMRGGVGAGTNKTYLSGGQKCFQSNLDDLLVLALYANGKALKKENENFIMAG